MSWNVTINNQTKYISETTAPTETRERWRTISRSDIHVARGLTAEDVEYIANKVKSAEAESKNACGKGSGFFVESFKLPEDESDRLRLYEFILSQIGSYEDSSRPLIKG